MAKLLDEIGEQPVVLRRLIDEGSGTAQNIAGRIQEQDVDHVLIAARGTSDNAATYAKYLFGIANGLPVALAGPSMYTIYGSPPKLSRTLVVAISQSGASPDIVSVVQDARQQGLLTLAITNRVDSRLGSAADCVMPLGAGEELSVAATKTYTAELLAIVLLSSALSTRPGSDAEVSRVPDAVASALSTGAVISERAERYRYMTDCAVIARGYNYATAFEVALKIKELTYCRATAYSSADFMHGPIAVVEPGYPVIIVAPSGRPHQELLDLATELRRRDAELIVISDEGQILDLAELALRLPQSLPEWLSPISAVIPGQLLAYHLALAKRLDPEKPRGLHKVTETR